MARKRVRFGGLAPVIPSRSRGEQGQSILKNSTSRSVYTTKNSPYVDFLPEYDQDMYVVSSVPRARREVIDYEAELDDSISKMKRAQRLGNATLDDTDALYNRSRRSDRGLLDSITDSLDLSVPTKVTQRNHVYMPAARRQALYLSKTPAPVPKREPKTVIDIPTFVDTSYIAPSTQAVLPSTDLMLGAPRTSVSNRILQAFSDLEDDFERRPIKYSAITAKKSAGLGAGVSRYGSAVPPRPASIATSRGPRYQPLYTGDRAELYRTPDWDGYSTTCSNLKDRMKDVVYSNSVQKTLLDRFIPYDMRAPIDEVDYMVDKKYNEVAERIPSLYRTANFKSTSRDSEVSRPRRSARSASVPPSYGGGQPISKTRAHIRDAEVCPNVCKSVLDFVGSCAYVKGTKTRMRFKEVYKEGVSIWITSQ
ncbi:unnamed protein product [Owenia fusiformis]|uniref:Uncharacterized protein n=1 Tax=Owenia fusiformis TaxID=6347 RepID=A0A8S4ND82_OWEFU|nr:unnamed protein product [Owenia fusiformis]